MNLTATEIKAAVAEGVAEGVAAGVAKQRDIDEEKHSRHHAFLDYWIEREERKRQRWDRVRTTVIGGAILAASILTGSGCATRTVYVDPKPLPLPERPELPRQAGTWTRNSARPIRLGRPLTELKSL